MPLAPPDGERELLKDERKRLLSAGASLRAEGDHLIASADRLGLRSYGERLHVHQVDVHSFHERLSVFHRLYGPLGD